MKGLTKIKYELLEANYCKTECPRDKAVGVASLACKECRYYNGDNYYKKYVLCAWTGAKK